MNEPGAHRDPGREAAGVPPYPDRPPAVGPPYPAPYGPPYPASYGPTGPPDPHPYDGWPGFADPAAPSGQPAFGPSSYPQGGAPGPGPRRRSAGYRLIVAAGFVAAAILAGGVGTLAFQEIQGIVAAQDEAPTLPTVDGAPLGDSLEHAHDGITVDWAAGPDLDEAGLDRGRRVTDAPGVVMVDTMLMNGTGTGTGIVLAEDGLAITNYHVVENSSQLTVTVADTGDVYTATVLGRDSLHDVAVLRIHDAPALQTVSIDTDEPARGDRSAAVGNGGGQGYLTAVTGRVTALDESIVASSGAPEDYARLTGLIETSADVVPGYSGGPLVDGDGQVVGITTAASQGEDTEAVDGYAIPVATALDVVEQVLSGEESDTVSIGVDGALGIVVGTDGENAVVLQVSPDSSAEKLGLQAGDTVRAINGQPVSTAAELSRIVNDHNVGDVVRVDWTTEDGRDRTGEVALQEAVVN